jgi:hypothetical protein
MSSFSFFTLHWVRFFICFCTASMIVVTTVVDCTGSAQIQCYDAFGTATPVVVDDDDSSGGDGDDNKVYTAGATGAIAASSAVAGTVIGAIGTLLVLYFFLGINALQMHKSDPAMTEKLLTNNVGNSI